MFTNNQVFIGPVKRCDNIYQYKEYGESYTCWDYQIGGIKEGILVNVCKTLCNHAVLIKVSDESYIWLDDINSIKDRILVNLGIPAKTLSNSPCAAGDLYVDSTKLVPYYQDEKSNDYIKVKKLKREIEMDVRIPGGIEY